MNMILGLDPFDPKDFLANLALQEVLVWSLAGLRRNMRSNNNVSVLVKPPSCKHALHAVRVTQVQAEFFPAHGSLRRPDAVDQWMPQHSQLLLLFAAWHGLYTELMVRSIFYIYYIIITENIILSTKMLLQ